MACAAEYLNLFKQLSETHNILFKGASILDIGSQNLLGASTEDVFEFITYFNPDLLKETSETEKFAERMAANACVAPGVTTTYIGEIFLKAGFKYLSFDIYNGFVCEIFDLNSDSLPKKYANKFDLVLNFGTTEHVFNQYNSFKIIHEATKPGGYIFHQVPYTGYLDHGFFNYQPKTFDSLKLGNSYETILLGFHEPQGASTFPTTYQEFVNFELWKDLQLPNGVINVLYKKTVDQPFNIQLDTSTTASTVSSTVSKNYLGGQRDFLRSLWQRLKK